MRCEPHRQARWVARNKEGLRKQRRNCPHDTVHAPPLILACLLSVNHLLAAAGLEDVGQGYWIVPSFRRCFEAVRHVLWLGSG